jgi:hypothetical protein
MTSKKQTPGRRALVPFGRANSVERVSSYSETRETGIVRLAKVSPEQIEYKRKNGQLVYLDCSNKVVYACSPEEYSFFKEAERKFLGIRRAPKIALGDQILGRAKVESAFDPYNLWQFYGRRIKTQNSTFYVVGHMQDEQTGTFERYTFHGKPEVEGLRVLALASQSEPVIAAYIKKYGKDFAEKLMLNRGLEPQTPNPREPTELSLVVLFDEPTIVGNNYLISSPIKAIR